MLVLCSLGSEDPGEQGTEQQRGGIPYLCGDMNDTSGHTNLPVHTVYAVPMGLHTCTYNVMYVCN